MQTRRFLRRLKFDLTGDDLDAVIDALAGPSPGGGGGGDTSDRSSHERGVSFESDGRGTKKAKRDGGDGGGGGVGVLYRDFLELVLAEQVQQGGSRYSPTFRPSHCVLSEETTPLPLDR